MKNTLTSKTPDDIEDIINTDPYYNYNNLICNWNDLSDDFSDLIKIKNGDFISIKKKCW